MRKIKSTRVLKDSKGNYEVGQRMASDLLNFCSKDNSREIGE